MLLGLFSEDVYKHRSRLSLTILCKENNEDYVKYEEKSAEHAKG